MGFIAALAGGLALFSQNEPVDLTLALPDKPVIETRIERSERRNDGEWSSSTGAYRIEVRREGDLSYRTVWRDLGSPLEKAVVVIADEALVPNRIENLDDVLNRFSEEGDGAALAFMRALPPETVTGLLFKDAIMIAYGQGTYLVPGERQAYQQPGGSFGDSGPLMMNASFLLESVKPEANRAVVVWVNELDPVEGRKALPGLIRDMFDLIGEDEESMDKLEALLADAAIVVRTECRYEIAIATGLAERIECQSLKDISIAGERRRDETRLTATQRLLD